MKFTATNSNKAKVYDVDTCEEIKLVMEVNTRDNTLQILSKVTLDYAMLTVTRKYRKIYPIYGDSQLPQLFHCYGRLNES